VFDLRYHVASLAAVFLMLVVGILIGVGISGRGFVDDAERQRLNGRIADLQEQVDAANASADDFERRQKAAENFVESAYPALAAKRLDGKNVAILVLGAVDPTVNAVEREVEEDADGRVSRMRALEMPLRLEAVEAALAKKPELGGYVGDEQLGNLGRDLGRELAAGGETPLWDALEPELVEVREGNLNEPVDGVIVMRTGEPQMAETSRFLAGLYQGLGSAGVPVVGVEPTRVEQSAIPVFQRYRLSTVDGVDTPVGALAMLLVLADPAAQGDYGVRDTADRILPPIEPLPAPSG
jgi:copper transport outer membrane protein MctB